MKDYVATNKQAYNQLAHEYEKRLQNKSSFEEPLDILIGTPYKYAKKYHNQIKVLDIGPGRGEASAYLEKQGCEVTAIDIAENILKVVKKVAPHAKLVCADILTYEIPAEEFNLIYCGALIHLFTLEDAAEILKNIWQGLKPNGILFINTTIHHESSEGYYVKHDYSGEIKRYRHKYTEEEFTNLITSNGFEILDEIRTDEQDRGKFWLGLVCKKF